MRSVTFRVPGKPQGKARARTFKDAHTGMAKSITPEKTVLYENFIKERYLERSGEMCLESGTPVALRVAARFRPPKSASKKRRQAMLEGCELPLKKPDADNILKVVADALNGIAYQDDKQIVLAEARKAYSEMEGLYITVEEYIEGK